MLEIVQEFFTHYENTLYVILLNIHLTTPQFPIQLCGSCRYRCGAGGHRRGIAIDTGEEKSIWCVDILMREQARI
jgi:hypothetical protein